MKLKYLSGAESDEWIFCGVVDSDDVELGNMELSDVDTFIRNDLGATTSILDDTGGNEITSYDAPQVALDPSYTVKIYGLPCVIVP